MNSDSEEFFDAQSSFHEQDKQSIPKSQDSEELKLPDLKSSVYSTNKNSTVNAYRIQNNYPTIKTASVPLKFKSKKKENEFNNIRLVQEIDLLEKQSFTKWLIKFSENANYLSISGTGSQIFIYNMFKRSTNYLSSSPEKILNRHTGEVTSLSWSKEDKLISSGRDSKVIMWDPTNDEPIKIFEHPAEVTFCKFYNTSSEHFISACKDKLLRVFNTTETKPLAYYQISMNCYSLDFDTNNKTLAVGLDKGEVLLYTVRLDFHLRLLNKLICKNRRGIYNKGKKVVGLKFVSNEWLMICTSDSRIRIMNFIDNTLVQKFKGLKNLKAKICPDFSLKDQTLVSGSEDGRICFWKYNPETKKNGKFESFEPRSKKTTEYTVIAPPKIEEDLRARFTEGDIKFVLFSIGAKDMLKIFLVLSK